MSRKKRLQRKAEKGKKAEAKQQAYATRVAANAKKKKKRTKKVVTEGIAHIKSTFNNTIVTLTDKQGNVISWATSGNVGFKGSKKSTPYASSMAAKTAATKAMEIGLSEIDVLVTGVGAGRDSAIRSLDSAGLKIGSIKDITPLPHNGPRPRKARRV